MQLAEHLETQRETDRALSTPPPGFLSRIASAIGTRAQLPGEAAGALDLEATRMPTNWADDLERRCRQLGLRPRPIDLAIADLSRASGRRCALVTWHEAAGWLAVTGPDMRSLRLIPAYEPDREVSTVELARLLDARPDEVRTWMSVEPTLSAAVDHTQHGLPPFRRLVELIRPDRADLIAIVIYAAFIGLLTLATPIAVQQLVNSVAFGGLVQPVVVLAALLFVGLAFSALLSTLQAYLVETIQRRVFVRACIDIADRLPRVRLEAFGDRHGPELVNRFFDLVTLQKTGASLLLAGTAVVLQTVAGLMILSLYHPLMFGFSLLLIVSIAMVVVGLGRGATTTAIAESSAKYELGAWMEELVRYPTGFRSRATRTHALGRADELAATWVEARRRHFRIVLRQLAASLGLQVIASTLVLALGGFLVVSGQLTLGQLVASEIIVAVVVAAVARLGKLLESFYDLLAAVDKVGVLLDLPPERNGGTSPARRPEPAVVEARELRLGTLRAPGEATLAALRIEAGERVGIAGPNGSGKSALLDLLCGLQSPVRGRVTFDGEDIEGLRLESLRDQVMLLREPEIYAGTIIDNIRLGRPEATLADAEEAIERVGLRTAVARLPAGLRTRLRPGGHPLSAGQARLLAVARAVVARPRFLALDDGLAPVDAAARARLLDVLFDPSAPWSLVVASHDPELLSRCDRIVTLRDQSETNSPADADSGAESVTAPRAELAT